jgi:aromatic-L-amino-acid decarboxylase
MSAHALASAVDADIAAGRVPAAVVATIGTTGTTAVDPLSEIIDVARRPGAALWVHVDAAMAGSALLLPECRPMFAGLDAADSMSWNPHKWIGTILDTSLYYTRRPDHLVRVMSTNPSYLRSAADGDVTQYRDWGIPLGRRFRALKLWFHLRIDGVEAIRDRMRRDIANAEWLADQVGSQPEWEVVAPVRLQTVCVRHRPAGADGEALDRHTLSWVDAVNSSGAALLTPSVLDGRWMVRVSIGAEGTERADVEFLWGLMQEAASAVT